jgi:hypothetical protein
MWDNCGESKVMRRRGSLALARDSKQERLAIVEQRTENPRVGGSIPSLATKIKGLGQHNHINCGISMNIPQFE